MLVLTPAGVPNFQVPILVSSALLTEGTRYGIGMHFQDIDVENLPTTGWISIAAGFCTMLGATWSKTSFGITLLRLTSSRWMRWLVWFIIISVNIVLGCQGLVQWIQCWPVPKRWIDGMPGSCWPATIVQNYMTFAAGTCLPSYLIKVPCLGRGLPTA